MKFIGNGGNNLKNKEHNYESVNALLKEIYLKYGQYIYLLAYKHLGDKNLAEDIVQDTIIKIREKIIKKEINSCHKIGRLIGYIVRGLCIDLIRRNEKVIYREIFDNEIKTEDTFVSRLIFNDAINKLPDKYKDIFIMKVLKDKSYSEIAKDLGLSESTVRKRVERARKILKEVLVGDDDE